MQRVIDEPLLAPVFNLTVQGPPEYYANGVLVHNCDAAVYAFMQTSAYGRAVLILPDDVSAPRRADLPGLPSQVAAWLDASPVEVCGRCSAFQNGLCQERGLQVAAHDPGCERFA